MKYIENKTLERLLTGDPAKRLTSAKVVKNLKQGYEISGIIIKHPDTGDRGLIELSAGRWLSNDEMWKLMHPINKHAQSPE